MILLLVLLPFVCLGFLVDPVLYCGSLRPFWCSDRLAAEKGPAILILCALAFMCISLCSVDPFLSAAGCSVIVAFLVKVTRFLMPQAI